MSVANEIIVIGFDKNREAEFGVTCSVVELSHRDMKELRAMIIVAIGTMEDMWRKHQMNKHENIGKDATP